MSKKNQTKLSVLNSYLSTLNFQFSIRKGFTLIELMVVIGIIAILSSAVIIAVNPSEQLQKASDSVKKQMVIDIHNAIIDYEISKNAFPWNPTSLGGAGCNNETAPTTPIQLNSPDFDSCITALIGSGGLKESLLGNPDLSSIYLTDKSLSSNKKIAVCFDPQSSTDSSDYLARHSQNGDRDCDNSTNSSCYWCAE